MKRKTVFVDIDGCIIKHKGKGVFTQWFTRSRLLPGVRKTFAQWESEGTMIILVTARPECLRWHVERMLRRHKLFWDQLIMGVGHGERIIINDAKPGIFDPSCRAVEIDRNKGLHYV